MVLIVNAIILDKKNSFIDQLIYIVAMNME